MAMLPGNYLRLRREAAGLSIEAVALMLPTEPHVELAARATWLRQIEAGEAPIGNNVIAALKSAFRFDASVLRRLDDLRRTPGLSAPRICRRCACTEYDPCRDRLCHWVAADLCSSCPEPEPGKATPIDDEDDAAAPSPDNDGEARSVAA